MSSAARFLLLAVAALGVPTVAVAQSPSPTLPSDTLQANFAPRSAPGPMPELAPSLPSDTLDTTAPMVVPEPSSGEMRRDWDQGEGGGDMRNEVEETDERRQKALEHRLG